MARTVYNQKNLVLTVDGTTIQDFFEGASIVFTYDGGEVDKTQGTDGASINIATNQGATIKFTLRETSRSRQFLSDLRKRQYNGGAGVTVVLRTGADVLENMTDAYIGNPGELSTGDKKQGGIQFTMMSAEHESSNMSTSGGNLATSGLTSSVSNLY
ncbi:MULTISPECIES: hypothetical protein [unclassified Desulfovibrio]|uniref:hypothetical protein n=1 Tax=unclassified Desulfovibrio TaxID=2593640 RepID=UPI002FDAEEE8